MTTRDDGGPFHPVQPKGSDGLPECASYLGASFRDVAAMHAMAGICASHPTSGSTDELIGMIAEASVKLADALIAELRKTKGV